MIDKLRKLYYYYSGERMKNLKEDKMNYENNKEKFKAAIQHVEKAVDILKKLQGTMGNIRSNDMAYFKIQLEEVLLSDHGECGMIPSVKTLF